MGLVGEVTDAPSPVMTFEVAGSWLGVRVEQVDKVAMAPRLWPVPLARPEHVGLFDNGQELVPVLSIAAGHRRSSTDEQLVALLQVRGETVGIAIDRAGRMLDSYRLEESPVPAPGELGRAGARAAHARETRFWLVDADRLFADASQGLSPARV